MNPLKPLLFLTYKTTFNGLKRAITTPKRLSYFIFFVLYYFWIINRVAFGAGTSNMNMPSQLVGKFQFPPLEVLDAIVFALFSFSYLIMLLATTNYQGTLRPADVDVLFPTPIPAKTVLAFRIARDYFFTLITPLFLALLGMRASKMGWEAIFRKMPHPEYSGIALRTITVSWILMAFCFVAVVHAVGLYVNRSDNKSDLKRNVLSWGIGLYVVGFVAFLITWFYLKPGLASAMDLAESPTLRTIFFLPLFATSITMAPFTGEFWPAVLGFVGMIAVIVLGLRLAFRQIGWYYDLAATKGYNMVKTRHMMRTGDQSGMMAERARAGKYKVRRFAWVYNLNMSGAKALIWKELVLQPRTILPLLIILFVCQVGVSALTALMGSTTVRSVAISGYFLIGMQSMMNMSLSMVVGQTGFLEVLRRVDLQKALPFTPDRIVRNELLGRSAVGIFSSWIGCLGFVILAPASWQFAAAAALLAPSVTLLLMATNFFVTILFPDIDDQTQRQFRGLMMLLGTVLALFFPGAIFIVLTVVKAGPILSGLAGSIAALGVTLVISSVAGAIYAGFNPSE
ncbi:MAG TPA: putative ABC exporter domain-containing protein [Fimbriimonadaceae bacterium]|jgi:hypothetical protein